MAMDIFTIYIHNVVTAKVIEHPFPLEMGH